jgi:hypothetical protein
MKRGSLLIIITSFFVFTTCVEPYDFEYGEINDVGIAIDGYLSDLRGVHEVRVSKTTKLGDSFGVEIDYVINARVSIIDDLGASIPLAHTSLGIYKTDENAVAEEGRSYKIRVVLINGTVYESSLEAMPTNSPETINIEYKLGAKELSFGGVLEDTQGIELSTRITKDIETRFYKWEINHYFIRESDFAPSRSIEEERTVENDALRFCFVKDFIYPELYLQRDFTFDGNTGTSYSKPLQFIPITNRFEYQFVIEAYMLELNEKAFKFWEDINTIANNAGGLFDAAPFSVFGNIEQLGDDEPERALGYFGVYRASMNRIFLTQTDLGLSITFNPCTPPMSPTTSACEDCRLYVFQENYENHPPAWWVY